MNDEMYDEWKDLIHALERQHQQTSDAIVSLSILLEQIRDQNRKIKIGELDLLKKENKRLKAEKSLVERKEKMWKHDLTCSICCDRKKSCVFAPCGHMTCDSCRQQLHSKICHICRRPIKSYLQCFL